ncbi:MAG TPA: glycosyltransferase family 39 protein, partial [Chthonomonadaceae bacterium]|nr:glycosyltransferase family 39 protein [Chthonomonadaceae bacterium]
MSSNASLLRLPDFAYDPRWQRATIWFLVITTLLRLCQLPTLELVPDEAYYWDWSRRPALGYYDQGPFIAYLIRATTALFGTNEFGVRFGVLLASLGTLICGYLLAKRLFSPLTGFLTVVLLGCTPLMEVGSLIATYDPPLVFFWALTVLLLERALFSEEAKKQNTYWLLAGVATGLGFLSKHTMLLILPCLVLFLLLSPRHRFWLLRPQPYLALLIVLLLYSGVIVWNAQHHWWTFGHLRYLTHKSSDTPLKRLGDFVGSQALLLGPVLFFGTLAASGWAWRRWALESGGRREERTTIEPKEANSAPTSLRSHLLFLLLMGLPVFLFFCLMTFRAKAQGNWAAFAWLTPTLLWSAWLTEWAGRAQKAASRLTGVAALSSLALTLLLIVPPLRYSLHLRLPPDADL